MRFFGSDCKCKYFDIQEQVMIKYLIEKEFKQIWRDRFLLVLIPLLPALVMLVFPWATTMEIKSVNISVLDYDHTPLSAKLINKISSTSYFNITAVAMNKREANDLISSGVADMVIEIPNGFEKELVNDRTSSLMVLANAVNGSKAGFGTSYLNAIIIDFAAQMNFAQGAISLNTMGGISVEPYYWFNPSMDYKIPMIPALIVLIVTLLVGFLPSMNIVAEKESGTIEQINVTPVSKFAFIAGKLIPYWIIGVIVLSIAILVSYLMFGLQPKGSIFLLYGISIFFILGISAMGLLISNYSSTMQQAMFTMFFLIIIIILMSGILTPISSMPEWAQVIAAINPMTYFAEIMKLIYLKGSTLADLMQYIYPLVVFFVIIFAWAMLSYRKRG